jgi:hypothetical protein
VPLRPGPTQTMTHDYKQTPAQEIIEKGQTRPCHPPPDQIRDGPLVVRRSNGFG